MLKISSLFTLLFLSLHGFAQYQVPVFPDLEGQELILELVKEYKPATVLTYGEARDTLYSKIYKRNDSVYCVYSGYALYLPPDTDPSTYLLMGGSNLGINTEHTYPQSKGAGEGNARSDMHHLFPARAGVNAARSNYPFAEIPDDETDTWYYGVLEQPFVPSSNIDLFSEAFIPPTFEERRFEPREDHKGNVARAIFYFYTMYRSEANAADPFYFSGMRETLCDWHFLDPVDSLEWVQNYQKATYQDGRPNPFILDCSLPERTYCSDLPLSCLTNTQVPNRIENLEIQAFPNPTTGSANLSFFVETTGTVSLEVSSILGKSVQYSINQLVHPGKQTLMIDLADTPSGIYLVKIRLTTPSGSLNTGYVTLIKQ